MDGSGVLISACNSATRVCLVISVNVSFSRHSSTTLLQLLLLDGWLAGLDTCHNKLNVFLEDVDMTAHTVLKVECVLIHNISWHIAPLKIG